MTNEVMVSAESIADQLDTIANEYRTGSLIKAVEMTETLRDDLYSRLEEEEE